MSVVNETKKASGDREFNSNDADRTYREQILGTILVMLIIALAIVLRSL